MKRSAKENILKLLNLREIMVYLQGTLDSLETTPYNS